MKTNVAHIQPVKNNLFHSDSAGKNENDSNREERADRVVAVEKIETIDSGPAAST